MRRGLHLLGLMVVSLAAACGLGSSANPSAGGATDTVPPDPQGPADGVTADDVDLSPANRCIEPACESVPLQRSHHALRLTKAHWERTMRDLLKLPAEPGSSVDFPPDPGGDTEHFGTEAGDLVVTSSHWRAFQNAAEQLAVLVAETPANLDKILPEAAKTGPIDQRVTAFVTDFLPRAYRRAVTPTEIAEVVALGQSIVQSEPDEFVLRVKWILTAVLQSSKLLYRVELGEGPVTGGRVRLGNYEIATKLSYALWGTMPDATLIGYARDGKLSTRAGVGAVAKEMLADPRADAVLVDFHDKFLLTEYFNTIIRNPRNFPLYYGTFASDAVEDLRRSVREIVITKNGGVKDIHTSTTAYANADMARVYGIDPDTIPALKANPTQFTRIEMDKTQRIGLLMHPGWLAFQGSPKDPSIIRRGAFMARHVVCLKVKGPPAAAAGADPNNSSEKTNRRRVEATTKGCGDGCHGGQFGIINPLGFAFERFDSLGQFRMYDGASVSVPQKPKDDDPLLMFRQDELVDPSGHVEDVGTFKDAVELFGNLGSNGRAHACYAAHWSAYLNGTQHIEATAKWLSPVVGQSLAGGSVRDLVTALVQSDAFLTVSR
ncbi:MAG: DUF1592 domain-containing protein [Labilithrix sp.]|nr:DUF1592 domain-containing protein [Labilithrix sp.]